jgi:hypothetical protein
MNEIFDYDQVAPELFGKNFLVARSIWFDPSFPERGFSIGGVITRVDVPDKDAFPLTMERIFVYVQFWGEDAEYLFRVRMVRIGFDEDGDAMEVHVGPDGQFKEFFMPTKRLVEVSSLEFVQQLAFPLSNVVFEEPATYEFQLYAHDRDEPIANERIEIRG